MRTPGPAFTRTTVLLALFGVAALGFPPATPAQVVRLGSEFQVNSFSADVQHYAAAAADDGSFVVVWESYSQDGAAWGIFGRRHTSVGEAVASEFQVNVHTRGSSPSASRVTAPRWPPSSRSMPSPKVSSAIRR